MTCYMKLKVADTLLSMFEVVSIFILMHLLPELKDFEQHFHVVLFAMHRSGGE